MKLVFKKNENGDVSVTMFNGTAETQFSYIEMIKALLAGEALDSDYDESISKEEQAQINDVLKEIETTAIETPEEDSSTEPDETEGNGELPFWKTYKDDYIEGMQNLAIIICSWNQKLQYTYRLKYPYKLSWQIIIYTLSHFLWF